MTPAAVVLSRCVDWLRQRTCLTITLFCCISLALFLAFTVVNGLGAAHHLDRAIIMLLRAPGGRAEPLGGLGFQAIVGELTSFGDHAVVIVTITGACGYLLFTDRRALALLLVAASLTGATLVGVLKIIAARQAHDIVNNHTYHVLEVWADSFPSGHATLAAIAYLTLGALLASQQRTHALKALVLGVALMITIVVGVTRIYLGIHYPTDVFAGWAIGAACAIGWMALARRIECKS